MSSLETEPYVTGKRKNTETVNQVMMMKSLLEQYMPRHDEEKDVLVLLSTKRASSNLNKSLDERDKK